MDLHVYIYRHIDLQLNAYTCIIDIVAQESDIDHWLHVRFIWGKNYWCMYMYIKKNPFTYSCLCAGESVHHHHGRGDAKPSNIPHTGGHPQAQVCFKWLWILFIIMETWSFPYWDCILYRYIKNFMLAINAYKIIW